jgi:hypothetical protein
MTNDNGVLFQECEWELGPIAHDLKLRLSASFWEDETGNVPAANIVSASETYFVRVTWELIGHLKRHFCGKWKVKIDLESIGKAEEYTSDCVEIEMEPCREDPYSYTFGLTAGDLKPHECGTVYVVAVTLSSLDPCGEDGHIWGYCKGPSVMFVP